MGNLFDKIAKDAAAELPRREVFRRIGGGLLGVVLAAVGLSARKSDCGKLCAECCHNLDSPPRVGEELGKCIQDCHAGLGPCGPIVCPQS